MKLNLVSGNKARKPLECPSSFATDNDDAADTDSRVILNSHDKDIQLLQYKNEGCDLAECGDYQGALNVWHRAIELSPEDHLIHELKAQAYLHLEMYLPALQAAQMVVELAPNWGYGFQTLARCQREMGEVCLSLQNYRTAVSLLPNDEEVAEELAEVQGLSDQLHQMRLERYRELELSRSAAESEANSCIYHLSARASGLIHSDSGGGGGDVSNSNRGNNDGGGGDAAMDVDSSALNTSGDSRQ